MAAVIIPHQCLAAAYPLFKEVRYKQGFRLTLLIKASRQTKRSLENVLKLNKSPSSSSYILELHILSNVISRQITLLSEKLSGKRGKKHFNYIEQLCNVLLTCKACYMFVCS